MWFSGARCRQTYRALHNIAVNLAVYQAGHAVTSTCVLLPPISRFIRASAMRILACSLLCRKAPTRMVVNQGVN